MGTPLTVARIRAATWPLTASAGCSGSTSRKFVRGRTGFGGGSGSCERDALGLTGTSKSSFGSFDVQPLRNAVPTTDDKKYRRQRIAATPGTDDSCPRQPDSPRCEAANYTEGNVRNK